MTLPAVQDVLQGAFDAYAGPRVQAAQLAGQQKIDALQSQVSALQALVSQDEAKITDGQQQLAAAQADLANAVAQGNAEAGTIAQLQQQIADLQAQLNAAVPGKAPAPPAGWVEAFRDDMNGSLSPSWVVADGAAAGNELSVRKAANVVCYADHVSILAKREAVSGRQYTSGYVTTDPHFSVPFGRWLIRARWTDLYGLWPALWLRFNDAADGTKVLGEIDIMEAVGTVRKLVQTVHQSTNGDQDKAGSEWPMLDGWSPSDWHVYELRRDSAGTLTWLIDGVAVFGRSRADLSTRLHQPMTWLTGPTFTGPLHLNINLQVGGTMPNYYLGGGAALDTAKILPAGSVGSLDIDYVQVLTPVAA